jgi:hypothetical protein
MDATPQTFSKTSAPKQRYRHPMRILLLALALPLLGQPADMQLTPERRDAIIESSAKRIEEMYVDPAKGKEIAAALRKASFPELRALALVPAVNRILKMSGDKHLRFGYDPAPSKESAEPAQRESGIESVKRLAGNVGLLTWKKFEDPSDAGDAVMEAMKQLASTDALIIDLRNSEGGSPEMVTLLLSCFMPADPVLISTVYFRPTDSTRQFWTLPYLPVPRYTGKPVYILTSSQTWSAGEGFSEHMQRLRHATLVGQTTRGGAHMSRWESVDPNFAVSVPIARQLEHDWEGVGVVPDVPAPEADALRTAHLLALKSIEQTIVKVEASK